MKTGYLLLEEAQNKIYESAKSRKPVTIGIENALGYVLADDVIAKITQPPFRRSAMDGYALRAKDIVGASENSPVIMPVVGAVYAGDKPFENLPENTAVRIMTGAPIPDEATVVVPQEMTDYGEKTVSIYQTLPAERNCVPKGEDFNEGDVLAVKGNVVDCYTIAAAVAGGIEEICVYPKIKAAIITTGNELVEPGKKIEHGQIYNSNKAFFENRLKEYRCEVLRAVAVSDSPEEIEKEIRRAMNDVDLIITTGGVSVGKRDYLPEVLEHIHAKRLWDGIDIKPGSPTLAATCEDKMFLCLSGNPYSAIAMFECLFPYYEKKVLEKRENRMIELEVNTINAFPKSSKKRRLVRGVLKPEGVFIPSGQRNGNLYSGIGTSCLVDIPAGTKELKAGERVKIHASAYSL